jgi:hypothetical protein
MSACDRSDALSVVRGGFLVIESSLGRLVAASELPVSRRKKELE